MKTYRSIFKEITESRLLLLNLLLCSFARCDVANDCLNIAAGRKLNQLQTDFGIKLSAVQLFVLPLEKLPEFASGIQLCHSFFYLVKSHQILQNLSQLVKLIHRNTGLICGCSYLRAGFPDVFHGYHHLIHPYQLLLT